MSSTATSLPTTAPADQADLAVIPHSTFRIKKAHLWAIIPLAIAWFAASIDVIEPFDFWWNVKSGEIMMQTGRFLGTDVLTWSPVREPYSNPQWGSQLLFYWAFSVSPYLLLTVRALIITATVGLLLWLCTWRSGSLRAGSVATIVAYFAAWTNYGMRPQLFAFLPFVAFLFLLERKDTDSKWLPLLVPIMILWVNVHGSFFLGVAMLGIYGFGTLLEKVRSEEGRAWFRSRAAGWQTLWFALAGLASLLNPYTAGIYSYFFAATNDPIARALNAEWQSPTIYTGTGQLFILQVAVLLTSIYLGKRRLRPTEILLIGAFGYLALTSLRNVMWWGWVTAPIIATNFAFWAEARRKTKDERRTAEEPTTDNRQPTTNSELYPLNLALVAILLVGAVLYTPLWRQANPLVPAHAKEALAESTPAKLAAFLKSGSVPAPIFNYMEWGGYLEWELYPRYQLFIDGRFEARQVQVWRDYLSISRGRADWQQTLDHYGARTLVLNKDFQADLLPFLTQSPTWHKVYEDKQGLVFTR
ncbi:MAG: hypothetical protein WCD37_17650 [Chloroflexia bacterium]